MTGLRNGDVVSGGDLLRVANPDVVGFASHDGEGQLLVGLNHAIINRVHINGGGSDSGRKNNHSISEDIVVGIGDIIVVASGCVGSDAGGIDELIGLRAFQIKKAFVQGAHPGEGDRDRLVICFVERRSRRLNLDRRQQRGLDDGLETIVVLGGVGWIGIGGGVIVGEGTELCFLPSAEAIGVRI